MGLLSRLRAWIGGALGADEHPESTTDADETNADGTDEDTGDERPGLDPSAATETRTEATDDAVDALRDVRRSHEGSPADETVDEPGGAAPSDADGDDRNAS